MEEELIDFIGKVAETPNVYLALAGDLVDNCTRNSIGSVFSQRYRPADQKKLIAKLLEPVRDRVLVAVQGNHEARSMKDADDCPLYDICCKLDIEHLYRENIAFVKIQMGDNHKSEGKRNPTYILAVTHGTGGGLYTGGAVNRNERFGYVLDGVDALITGHTHKPVVSSPGKIKVNPFNNTISVVPFKVVTATSWLEYGGYAARKMLLPATHTIQTMTLRGKKKEIIVTM
jgi:predicted phosphodiesterase